MSRKNGDISAIQTENVSRARRNRARSSLFVQGESMVWTMGGGLVVALVMIIGLLALVFFQGVTTFWPVPVERVSLDNGRVLMGEVTRRDHGGAGDENGGH